MVFKKGQIPWNKGRHWTENEKLNISQSLLGRNVWNKGLTKEDERVEKYAQKLRGKIRSEEHKITYLRMRKVILILVCVINILLMNRKIK